MRASVNAPEEAPKESAKSAGVDMRSEEHVVVALVGSPNSGKTTLFNWLTGSRFKDLKIGKAGKLRAGCVDLA